MLVKGAISLGDAVSAIHQNTKYSWWYFYATTNLVAIDAENGLVSSGDQPLSEHNLFPRKRISNWRQNT